MVHKRALEPLSNTAVAGALLISTNLGNNLLVRRCRMKRDKDKKKEQLIDELVQMRPTDW